MRKSSKVWHPGLKCPSWMSIYSQFSIFHLTLVGQQGVGLVWKIRQAESLLPQDIDTLVCEGRSIGPFLCWKVDHKRSLIRGSCPVQLDRDQSVPAPHMSDLTVQKVFALVVEIFYSVTQASRRWQVTVFMNEAMNHSLNRFVLIHSGMKKAAVFMSEFLNHSFNRFAQKH